MGDKGKNVVRTIVLAQIILIVMIVVYINRKRQVVVTPIDKNTVQQIPINNLKYFYDLKPSGVATWSASFLKKPVTNIYNNDGLNDTKNYSVEKPLRTFRIIALGDSYTYGHFVETKDNWTELLENKLNEKPLCKNIDKFEVLNFGVHGYDPEYEVEKYRRSGQKYNPDLVIWMLTDLERINEDKTPLFYDCLKNHPDGENTYCSDYVISKLSEKQLGREDIINKQKEVVNSFRDIFNGPIFFVDYYNTHGEIIKSVPNSVDFSEMFTNKYLLKNYSKDKIEFVDTHPNVLGHQLIANIIFNQVFKTKQIPCDSIK